MHNTPSIPILSPPIGVVHLSGSRDTSQLTCHRLDDVGERDDFSTRKFVDPTGGPLAPHHPTLKIHHDTANTAVHIILVSRSRVWCDSVSDSNLVTYSSFAFESSRGLFLVEVSISVDETPSDDRARFVFGGRYWITMRSHGRIMKEEGMDFFVWNLK